MDMVLSMGVALGMMGFIAVALAVVLAWGGKRFEVETDPRIADVEAALPGVNCGACGFAGCAGYADAIVNGGAGLTLCAPGGAKSARAVASVMGVTVNAAEPKYAVLACPGSDVALRCRYDGVPDCRAAAIAGIGGGAKECRYGCLGYGTCAKSCPFGAITMTADRMPVVDETKCTGCGRCTQTCPRNLFAIGPESRVIHVKCKNCDKGAVVNKMCIHGCFACGKCVRECPFDAIHVVNNLAVIDYDKCKLCGKCVLVCPRNVIVNLRARRQERKREREAAQTPASGGHA